MKQRYTYMPWGEVSHLSSVIKLDLFLEYSDLEGTHWGIGRFERKPTHTP